MEQLALDLLPACVFHVEHLWITCLSPVSWPPKPFAGLARFAGGARPTLPKQKQAHPIFKLESAASRKCPTCPFAAKQYNLFHGNWLHYAPGRPHGRMRIWFQLRAIAGTGCISSLRLSWFWVRDPSR